MSRQNPALHSHLERKKKLTFFDKVIILAACLYPLSALPQVVEVFSGRADGVSLWSWVSFICFSILFLAYGLIHKITPMIITNSLWLAVDGLVIVGLLVTSSVI
jgi:uncharacterized protein with PQ loop repeat